MRILILVFALACSACQRGEVVSDYDNELAAIDAKIIEFFGAGQADPDAVGAKAYHLYRRATLSGDFTDYQTADKAIEQALDAHGPLTELLVLQANLNFKLHRLGDAKTNLLSLAARARPLDVAVLRADIAFQEGRYGEALTAYEALVEKNRSWDNVARLAYYKTKTGNSEEADALYEEAGEMLSVKEMRSYAWIELQRGLLDLEFERYKDALEHYQRADRAYSGYWLIEEHIAEALHLTGKTKSAIALYKKVIDKTQNPEFISALADIIEATDEEAADRLYQQADQLFELRYALYPDAARGHFIEHLLERDELDSRLLSYAADNHQLRPNAEAKLLLLHAYRKTGNENAARQLMQEILSTPWQTPEVRSVAKQMGLL